MNAVDFCYWLQGNFELNDVKAMSKEQMQVIQNHLNLVFVHEIDPIRENESNATVEALNAAHSGADMNAIKPNIVKPNNMKLSIKPAGFGNDPLQRC